MGTPMPYIAQEENGYSCCILIAYLNALRFWGVGTVAPGDQEWESWIDRWYCRRGPVVGIPELRSELQIEYIPLNTDADVTSTQLPLFVGHLDPWAGFHASLVVAVNGTTWTVVNRSGGTKQSVQSVDRSELEIYKLATLARHGLPSARVLPVEKMFSIQSAR